MGGIVNQWLLSSPVSVFGGRSTLRCGLRKSAGVGGPEQFSIAGCSRSSFTVQLSHSTVGALCPYFTSPFNCALPYAVTSTL